VYTTQDPTGNPYATDKKMLDIVMKLFDIRLLWFIAVMIHAVGRHLQQKYFDFIQFKAVEDRVGFDIRMATGDEAKSDVRAILSSATRETLTELKLVRKELSFDGESLSVMQQQRFDSFTGLMIQMASERAWGVRHWQLRLNQV
jgi:hypothetical protein